MNRPKRSLSQNFLTDKHVLSELEDRLPMLKGKTVAEIGPGRGALTNIIQNKEPSVLHLIEKDDRLADEIIHAFPEHDIIHRDILDYDFTEDTVIGAIPYGISRDILKSIVHYNVIEHVYLIVQKEFAEKITTQKIKTLPLFVNTFFDAQILMKISRHAFTPVPGVDSALLYLRRKRDTFETIDEYWTFLNNISTNKRKIVSNVLPVKSSKRIYHMQTEEIFSIYADRNLCTH